MQPLNIEDVDRVTRNRYEAVIIAAQHARNLNARRLHALKALQEGATTDLETRKITAVSLRDLIDSKVNYERADTDNQ